MLFSVRSLGSGSIFGIELIPENYRIAIFGLAPGAFFVLAGLTALQNKFKAPSATNGSVAPSKLACGGNCLTCSGSACQANHEALEETRRKKKRLWQQRKQPLQKAAAAKKAAAEKAAAEKTAE